MRSVWLAATLALITHVAIGADALPPPELRAPPLRRNFDLRGDARSLFQQVAKAFGLDCVFDGDYRGPEGVRFRVEDVGYREALQGLQAATGSFIVPISSGLFLVANDTPAKRNEIEPNMSVSIPIPHATSAQELTEIIQAVKGATGVEKIGWDTQASTVVLRGAASKVIPAQRLFDQLIGYRAEVMVELDLYETTRGRMLDYGLAPPSVMRVVAALQGNSNAISLAQLGRWGSAGLALGWTVADASVVAKLSESSGKSLFHMELRSADRQPVTFHVGDRYPVLTAAYAGGIASPTTSSTTTTNPSTITNPSTGTTTPTLTISTFATVQQPSAVIAIDLNGDTVTDLAATSSANTATVLYGNGNGTLQDPISLPVGTNPAAIASGDLDGDGRPDLVTANADSNDISVLLRKTDGSFRDAVQYPAGSQPAALAIADFDGDGKLDIAVANAGSDGVSILLGRGDGTFGTPVAVATGSSPRALLSGDFNGDQIPDLAVANYTANTLTILLGNGDGTFRTAASYAAGSAPRAITAGLLDRDNALDLVVANSSSNTVSVFLGDGNGGFANGVQYATASGPVSVAISDFNSDALPDVVVACPGSSAVSLLLSLGNGTLQTAIQTTTGTDDRSLAIADFNRDGYRDIVLANTNNSNFSLLLGAGTGGFSDTSGQQLPSIGGQTYAPPPSFNFEDLGLSVKVTPRVSGDDDVTLEIQAEFKMLTGQFVDQLPVVSQRKIVSMLRLGDGQQGLLAGLLNSSDAHSITGWPGMSQVPVLGRVLRETTHDRSSSEILVLVRPRLLSIPPNQSVNPAVRIGSETRPAGPL